MTVSTILCLLAPGWNGSLGEERDLTGGTWFGRGSMSGYHDCYCIFVLRVANQGLLLLYIMPCQVRSGQIIYHISYIVYHVLYIINNIISDYVCTCMHIYIYVYVCVYVRVLKEAIMIIVSHCDDCACW